MERFYPPHTGRAWQNDRCLWLAQVREDDAERGLNLFKEAVMYASRMSEIRYHMVWIKNKNKNKSKEACAR